MATPQPLSTDNLDSPDHSLMHRQIAADTAAPVKSIEIDSSGNVTLLSKQLKGLVDPTLSTDAATKDYVDSSAWDGDIADIDLDGGTDIGADLADADLVLVDDGAAGTNRKSALSRFWTYISSKLSGGAGITYAAGEFSLTGDSYDASNVAITGGSVAGITDLAVADGGTGASDAATARSNLSITAEKLDDFAAPDDNTDLDATTGRHGLLPKLGGGTSNFLRADGSWAAPSGDAWDGDITDIDLDGGTDIGADLADADLILVDDGAVGTNRKSAVSRLWTYIAAKLSAVTDVSSYSWVLDQDDLSDDDNTKVPTQQSVKSYVDDLLVTYGIACSDETTDLTTGAAKATFRMPHAMTLTAVRANVNTAPTGATLTVDINEGGTSILSTEITIDAGEKTSTTAATAPVISDSALADDAEITVDIDQIGSTVAGKGLKVWLIGKRA